METLRQYITSLYMTSDGTLPPASDSEWYWQEAGAARQWRESAALRDQRRRISTLLSVGNFRDASHATAVFRQMVALPISLSLSLCSLSLSLLQ